MIRPLKEDFISIAHTGHLVPVVKELPADQLTTIDAYYATKGSYLLESAERGAHLGRYSFIGVELCASIELRGKECRINENGVERIVAASDPLRVIREFLNARTYVPVGDMTPFPGGAVGYIGYESVAHFEKITFSEKPSIGIPDACFIVTRFTLAFDNLMHTLKIICNVPVGDSPGNDYDSAVAGIERIEKMIMRAHELHPSSSFKIKGEPVSRFDKDGFVSAVSRAKKYIEDGDAIQVVVSRSLEMEYEGDIFEAYRSLRSINPSPYMFYLDFGGFTLFGASPEVMIRVDGKNAMLRPIAGTRRRGKTAEEDERNACELLSDEKERAEHIMLVDLARNDLGRVAKAGSVKVTRYMEVERYSHVMHIVSEVTCELGDVADPIDVIRATFPAGTVSGAPKVRAMQIIEELEPTKREHYAGLIGYFSYLGTFDSCITIRSAAAKDGKVYLQAGAGIVYDSNPEREYEETNEKLGAVMSAVSSGRE